MASKRHLAFFHQNYPAQFGPVAQFLLKEYDDIQITFVSEYVSKPVLPGVRHIPYQPVKTGHEESPYFFSRYFEQECASMHGIYNTLQASGIPDIEVMIGHAAFGTMGLLHVAYPDVPKIGFFELFYNPFEDDVSKRPEYPVPLPNRLRVPLRNATQLVELEYCTKGYSPTAFQRSTYPEVYQPKLATLFDGIDVSLYSPGEVTPQSELMPTWPKDAKIVTYVSRGLEAMRGFDIFMQVAHRVSLKRDDVHFVIAGNPKTHYGSEMISLKETTFKDHVLKQLPYDLTRYHFLNWISEPALVDLFRLSACHFYWTVPFTLSWSLFQAMATGALILGSNTAPVRDAVTHQENGLLAEPYDIDAMEALMIEALDNPERFRPHREAAREQMVRDFSFEVCLPRLAEFFLT
jgi:glycosyltransferase involved in cell wall biosynthesis